MIFSTNHIHFFMSESNFSMMVGSIFLVGFCCWDWCPLGGSGWTKLTLPLASLLLFLGANTSNVFRGLTTHMALLFYFKRCTVWPLPLYIMTWISW